MNRILYPLILSCCFIFSGTALAGAPIGAFIPEKPSITAPASQSKIEPNQLDLKGSVFINKDVNENRDAVFHQAEWMFSQTGDNVEIIGGISIRNLLPNETPPLYLATTEISPPFDLSIGDTGVAKIHIYNSGSLQLRSADDVWLAGFSLSPTHSRKLNLEPATSSVLLKRSPEKLIVQWNLGTKPDTTPEWSTVAQIEITKDGVYSLRLSNNDISSPYFNLENEYNGIGCDFMYNNPGRLFQRSIDIKNQSQLITDNQFSMSCQDGVAATAATPAEPILLEQPTTTSIFSDSENYFATQAETPEPGTYQLQLRHYAKASDDTSEEPLTNSSNWSNPVSITIESEAIGSSGGGSIFWPWLILLGLGIIGKSRSRK